MSEPVGPAVRKARAAWIRTLKSPGARKTTRRLVRVDETGERRCCLGHACAALKVERSDTMHDDGSRECFYDGYTSYLPRHVARRLDITRRGDLRTPLRVWRESGTLHTDASSNEPPPETATPVRTLAELNDAAGLAATPTEMATFLEIHFDHLKPYRV